MSHSLLYSSETTISSKMTKKPGTKMVWYISMLLVACLAGSMDWRMQRYLESMTSSVQAALRMGLFDLMEKLEAYELEKKAQEDEDEAHELEEVVQGLQEKSDAEHSLAGRARSRGEFVAKLARFEEERGEMTLEQSRHNEELRQKVLVNITQEEIQHKHTLDEIRAIHEGMCNWTLVSRVCDTLGGATGLSQRANVETLHIQAEYRQAAALERREKLEQIVAMMLQNKAARYQETAAELQHMAEVWDEHAQRMYDEMMHNATTTAQKLEQEASVLDQKAKDSEILEHAANLEAHKLLHTAEMDHVKAYWCAVVALLAATMALIFFVVNAVPKMLGFLGDITISDYGHGDGAVSRYHRWKNICYVGLHVHFFGLAVGIAGEYFIQLPNYTVEQRAIVVVWFAFVGCFLQTFFLHAIPRILVESRAVEPNLYGYVLYIVTKGVVIFLLFGIEVLFSWVTMGSLLFSVSIVACCKSPLLWVSTVVSSLIFVYHFDGQAVYPTTDNESITVWRCGDEESTLMSVSKATASEASEITPLNKEEVLSPGTTVDLYRNADYASSNPTVDGMTNPQDGLAGNEREAMSQTAKTTNSRDSVLKEIQQLMLPFEALVIVCMLAVLRNCVHTIWNSQATLLQCAVFACASALLLLGFILVKDLTCCEECYSTTHATSPKPERSVSKKGLDALELVEV